jgi:hypothetical protein
MFPGYTPRSANRRATSSASVTYPEGKPASGPSPGSPYSRTGYGLILLRTRDPVMEMMVVSHSSRCRDSASPVADDPGQADGEGIPPARRPGRPSRMPSGESPPGGEQNGRGQRRRPTVPETVIWRIHPGSWPPAARAIATSREMTRASTSRTALAAARIPYCSVRVRGTPLSWS